MMVTAQVAEETPAQAEVPRMREVPRLSAALDLVALPTAVTVARLFVADTMRRWGALFIEPDMEAITAELVTLAVLDTGPAEGTNWRDLRKIGLIKVCLIGFRKHIVVEVVDEHHEALARPDDGERREDTGLGLIDARSKTWGSCLTPQGRVMWAELGVYERTATGLPRRAVTPSPRPRPSPTPPATTFDAEFLQRVRDGLENL
jgi:hypothetical protein